MKFLLLSAAIALIAVAAQADGSDDPPMCPEVNCLTIAIPDECRQVNYVTGRDGITQCPGCDTDKCAEPPLFSKRSDDPPMCPEVICLAIAIPEECRQENYVTGPDGSQCRGCDTDKCAEPPLFSKRSVRSQVCPAIGCPIFIRPECRKPNFVTGSDGKTQCRVCDSDKCTDGPLFSKRSVSTPVCPLTGCPYIYIPPECVQENYVLGSDGKTQCRVCDTDTCTDGPLVSKRSVDLPVCPLTGCPYIYIRPECVQENYVLGSDGKTQCRVCDTDTCTDGPLVSKRSVHLPVCPLTGCRRIYIRPECVQANYVLGSDGKTQCRVCDTDKCKDGPVVSKRSVSTPVCPLTGCPFIYIPPECVQENYVLGSDGMTQCRVCDTDTCTDGPLVSKRSVSPPVCPLTGCPYIYIPPECVQENYVLGSDGKTQCRVCDTDTCTDGPVVSKRSVSPPRLPACPLIGCPRIFIRPECVQENYVLGTDGKTQCRVCDTDKCADGPLVSKRSVSTPVCPLTGCPYIYIPPECVQENYVLGSDGKTQCRVCDTDTCTDGPLVSKR